MMLQVQLLFVDKIIVQSSTECNQHLRQQPCIHTFVRILIGTGTFFQGVQKPSGHNNKKKEKKRKRERTDH